MTKKISPVGLGTYRMSLKSNLHYETLKKGIELGCNLIDTSSNYTDGDSEKLIGKFVKENPNKIPFIITKAGYIQGSNLGFIDNLGDIDIIEVDDALKHSIHPTFLKDQLERSLKRMEIKKVDTFLLHNPEYFFEQEAPDEREYYKRIQKAFEFLEEMVEKGKIGSYGISSNTFVHSPLSDKRTNLDEVFQCAQNVSQKNHFKYIQFPLNIFEKGALNNHFDGKNLIERAKDLELKTISNRPLNAFTKEGLFRLAEYDFEENNIDKEKAHEHLEKCLGLIENKIQINDPTLNLRKIPFIEQFCEIWCDLPSPDACQQVYFDHFFPLISRIWGKNGLSVDESQPFYELFEYSEKYSRLNMSMKATILKRKLNKSKQLEGDSDSPLTCQVIEKYLNWGIDHVLVGMRNLKYLEQLKSFFNKV